MEKIIEEIGKNIMKNVNINLDRKELYSLIKGMHLTVKNAQKLVMYKYGSFINTDGEFSWNMSKLDEISLDNVLEFYKILKEENNKDI